MIRSSSGIADELLYGRGVHGPSETKKRFGAIAVRKGFVSLEEVKSAISEQIDDDINGREHRLLGTILYDNGFITEYQIDIVLQELKKSLQ